MTNQQLAETCRDILAEADKHESWCVEMAKALLPCLESKPVAWATMQPSIDEDERTVFTKKYLAERFSKICYDLTPLYPSPPVPCLILPAQRPDFEKGDPVDIEWRGMCDGFNSCIEEVKRLNAPHTAHIETSCATGGAWVKCCDDKPDIDVTVWCYGQYDDGSDDTENYSFPGYMDKKGRWFACNNGDYVDGGYGNDYRACVARWMPLPAAPEAE